MLSVFEVVPNMTSYQLSNYIDSINLNDLPDKDWLWSVHCDQMFQYFPRSISSSRHLIYLLRKTLVAAIMTLIFQVRDQRYEETKYSSEVRQP